MQRDSVRRKVCLAGLISLAAWPPARQGPHPHCPLCFREVGSPIFWLFQVCFRSSRPFTGISVLPNLELSGLLRVPAGAGCPPDFSHVLPTVQTQRSSLCSHFTQPQLRKMLKLNQSSFLGCSNTKSCSATPERGGGVGTASPRRNKLLN